MRAMLSIALSALVAMMWAASKVEAAHYHVAPSAVHSVSSLPLPVRLLLRKERGLLLEAWLNGKGPFVFVLDTGAGMNLINERVLAGAGLTTKIVPRVEVGGLSGVTTFSNREAAISRIALGDASNVMPSATTAVVVSSLPPDIDGVLDPTETYSPYGYSIDLPNGRVEMLDTSGSLNRPRNSNFTSEGAIVPWVRIGSTKRPFVKLGDGRLALIDTGSSFGLAVNERHAVLVGNRQREGHANVRDLGTGMVTSRRVSPTTISIGELVLRRVPTDILFGVEDNAPLILGRDALYPFKITFDPRRQTIEFLNVPSDY